jgi:hypothetical protein
MTAPSRTAEPATPALTIAALRERGAHRLDPVRFRFIEALARRASAHAGETRRVLDARLAQVLADYGHRHGQDRPAADDPASPAGQPQTETLAGLVQQLARHAAEHGGRHAPADPGVQGAAPAELKALQYFRSTWCRLSVDQQLSQSLAKFPENAGPLNSHRLVLRSLQMMRDISPAYLQRLMSYVDALLWLDQASAGGVPATIARRPRSSPSESGR